MIIDMEHHASVEDVLIKGSSQSGKVVERYWDTDGKMKIRTYQEAGQVARRLQFMDESGIDIAVLTANPVANLADSRKWNDFCAGLVKTYPKRFIGFASVPVLGGEPALEEMERAVKVLGLRGVHIWTQCQGRHLDSKELWPFYRKVSELRVPWTST